jgi:hypothetical protein
MRTLHRFALGTLVAGCLLPALAAADNEQKEPPEHYVSVGEVEVVIKSATSTSITIQNNQVTLPPAVARLLGGGGGKGKNAPKDTTLDFTSDCKVRVMHLPPVYDKEGKKTVRSPEEINKLKGNSNLPGFEAEASDLKANQVVKVTLVKPKNALAAEATKLYVKRILIEKDAPASKTPDKKPDEKKK